MTKIYPDDSQTITQLIEKVEKLEKNVEDILNRIDCLNIRLTTLEDKK